MNKMKMKRVFSGFILCVVYLTISSFLQDSYIPENGFVPDEETAVKVAEAILIPIYGNKIKDEMPFNISLKDDKVWVITGTLHNAAVGGVVYVEIRKSDCTILKVIHGQ